MATKRLYNEQTIGDGQYNMYNIYIYVYLKNNNINIYIYIY